MRIVILGCGRLGAHLARQFTQDGHEVVVIDRERDALEALGSDFPGETVVGMGIDAEVLRRAGIERADVFIAVTGYDNTNIMAAEVAREIFGVPRVITRLNDPLRAEIFQELGLKTVSPTALAVEAIRKCLED
ncbi:MAG: TrkA family potassium uptake protein [Anaerolineae bacterium]|nr:TrkA family potassium uptake protein [Thermoflexus sp.]MDW8064423.1 TrkA family potassium uptake protein [Anaerolineae bacterium]